MGKFDDVINSVDEALNSAKISNFEEVFSKTKTVAESVTKKSAQRIEVSRKKVEYLDAKTKLAKAYEKYGKIQFDAYLGGEIDENELDPIIAEITTYREKLELLKAELEESKIDKNSKEYKREARELKREVKEAQKEAMDALRKSAKSAKDAIRASTDAVRYAQAGSEVDSTAEVVDVAEETEKE